MPCLHSHTQPSCIKWLCFYEVLTQHTKILEEQSDCYVILFVPQKIDGFVLTKGRTNSQIVEYSFGNLIFKGWFICLNIGDA